MLLLNHHTMDSEGQEPRPGRRAAFAARFQAGGWRSCCPTGFSHCRTGHVCFTSRRKTGGNPGLWGGLSDGDQDRNGSLGIEPVVQDLAVSEAPSWDGY